MGSPNTEHSNLCRKKRKKERVRKKAAEGEQNGNKEEVPTVNCDDVHMKKNTKRKCEKEMKEGNDKLTNSNEFVTEKRKKVKHKVTDEECELGSDEVCGSSAKKSKKDKKKKKKVPTESESISLSGSGVNSQDQCPSVKKKKRKKSVVLEDEMESDEEKICVKSMEDSQKKKSKKKTKSKDKKDECVRDLTEMCDEDKQSKKEKKKKKKSKDKSEKCLEDLTKMYDGTDASNKQSKKEKKKKPTDKDKDTDDRATEPENKGRKGKHKMTDHGTENGITEDSESVHEDSSERPSGKKRKKKKGKDTDDEPDLKKSKGGLECGPRTENKKISSDPDPAYTGQWTTASLGDEQRQNKFLRLLGGFKAAKSDAPLLSTLGGKCGNVAMTQNQENLYMRSMEDQYGKAMSFNKNRGLGLGFEKPPSEGKKFYIDKNMSKSKKFND